MLGDVSDMLLEIQEKEKNKGFLGEDSGVLNDPEGRIINAPAIISSVEQLQVHSVLNLNLDNILQSKRHQKHFPNRNHRFFINIKLRVMVRVYCINVLTSSTYIKESTWYFL